MSVSVFQVYMTCLQLVLYTWRPCEFPLGSTTKVASILHNWPSIVANCSFFPNPLTLPVLNVTPDLSHYTNVLPFFKFTHPFLWAIFFVPFMPHIQWLSVINSPDSHFLKKLNKSVHFLVLYSCPHLLTTHLDHHSYLMYVISSIVQVELFLKLSMSCHAVTSCNLFSSTVCVIQHAVCRSWWLFLHPCIFVLSYISQTLCLMSSPCNRLHCMFHVSACISL